MVKLSQIYELLNTQDKALHNIAIELAKRFDPKWKLKVIYGKGSGYYLEPIQEKSHDNYILNSEYVRYSSNLNRHTYKNYEGEYVVVKEPKERPRPI